VILTKISKIKTLLNTIYSKNVNDNISNSKPNGSFEMLRHK